MQKRYLVIGNWIDKTTDKPMSGIAEVTGGVGKNGKNYELANVENREKPIEGYYPVGTILTAAMNLVVQDSKTTTSSARPTSQ